MEIAALLTALWLGIVTSVSPCPLATNVAAVSVLARRIGDRRRAVAGAVLYAVGRMAVYLVLALVVIGGLASMPALSAFLRREIVPLVGPVLILAGLVVIGWVPLPVNWRAGGAGAAAKLSKWGLAGEFLLGGLFALSFCPTSAALFFGSLLPLAMAASLPAVPVAIYGFGTALPVGVLAVLLVVSSAKAARALDRVQSFQKFALVATGVILVGVGVWLTLGDTLDLW
ncbi:MAG: aromatic aminobenezylarsenical efflux permease ArsG family transporter [Verrucomicrobiales bacterium]